MQRRQFLYRSAAALAGSAVAYAAPAKRPARPNIVFMMADDMGPFDLGCYGQKLIKTPNMDRVAAEGMRFTDCYAGASVCAPSRSVLMTGQHTGHTRIRGNMSARTGGRVSFTKEERTIASLLKGPEWKDEFNEDMAYKTALFGKWGLGEPDSDGLPNDHGFDEFFGFLNQQHAHRHYPRYLWRNKTREPLHGNDGDKQQEYASDLFVREALHFIDRNRYQPFFLYFTPTVPHAEFKAPDAGPYANQPWPDNDKYYAAMVTRFDDYVGKIMAKLKETGLDENTIVFVCSDNGGTSLYKPFASLGPFREKKGSLTEGGLRTPMLVRWPGKIKAGVVNDTPWGFQDVLPTVGELAQVRTIPPNIDGVSVLPALLGKTQDKERPLYWEQAGAKSFTQAVRMGKWKAIRKGLDAPLELYDLTTDIGETKSVASSHPDVVRKMESFLADCRTDSAEYPVPKKKA